MGAPLYVAMHEAGHAVAMLANEAPIRVDYVSVSDQVGAVEGFTAAGSRFQPAWHLQCPRSDNEPLAQGAWLDVVETLSGPVAEWRFRGISKAARILESRRLAAILADTATALREGEDAQKVVVRLKWRNEGAIEEEVVNAFEEAEELLRPHWKRVLELGRWLHRVKRIEGQELLDWWRASVDS